MTPSPSPMKTHPSDSGEVTATMNGESVNGLLNTPRGGPPVTPPPPEGDSTTLRAECQRLAKELTDTKRKFLAATKKKKEEMDAK